MGLFWLRNYAVLRFISEFDMFMCLRVFKFFVDIYGLNVRRC